MHRKLRFVLVSLAIVALLAAGCGDDCGSTEAAASDGPSFAAATLDGTELASADLDGPTVLWFWAPWCTICRSIGQGVADAAEQLGDDVRISARVRRERS